MITDIFFGLIDMFLSLLPEFDLSIDISGAVGAVSELFGYVNNFVSVNAILTCISLVLVVDNFSFIVKIFNFIIRKIPGIS